MNITKALIFCEDPGLLDLYQEMLLQVLRLPHLSDVVTARDRPTAYTALQSKFDIIVLDVFTGIGISTQEQYDELIHTAQRLQPETPIILVTHTPDLNHQVFANIAPPFACAELGELVCRALKIPVSPA